MIEIARRFAAYIPVTLVRQLMDEGLPEPGEPRPLLAATLFSDISGFTKMSEELASDGARGAEELNRVLLMTFTAMIDVIHEMGGAVSHFYGDAMSVYFPETAQGDAAQRALACAQLMQKVMAASFERVVTNRPPGKDPFFALTIKIGVGYGHCQEIVVGDSDATLEFVLTGTAVDEAAAAEKIAQSGEVVASAKVMAQAGLIASCEARDYCVVTERIPPVTPSPILNWSAYDETALAYLIAAAGTFIPDVIAERLQRGGHGEIAEHRPVTSLFVDFDFVGDVDDTSDVKTAVLGKSLHEYYLWASRIVARFGGLNARINRILTGDKGNQLHIIFGAPVAPDAPEQAIRCAMALVKEKPDYISSQRIGLAAGKVFAGPVGAVTRREYTVVGDMVNLSARLAQICHENCVYTNSITAGRVDNWIEFEVLPPVLLKGKEIAVSPYRPIGERDGSVLMQAYFNQWERPLVGRETELDLLLGGMDVALHGIGGVAAILGAVGVGKTHLLAKGIRYWLDGGGNGLVGIAQQHTSDVPYGPWLNIWRDFFNLRVDMSATVQAEHVVAQTLALVPDVGDDLALWGDVLGLPIAGQENLAELSAEVKQARFFALVRRCFLVYSDLTPLLIVLEDAHWADKSSLALLDEVTKNIADHKLFFTATFRLVEELTLDMLNRSSCVPILVSDLSPSHARDLLFQLVGVAQLPLAVEQHLGLRDREGRDSPVSPLFLEESIKMMIGTGVLNVEGQVSVDEERLQTLQIPDTIHGLLLARLDRLPPAGRDLLQVAAVIGRQFALEPLFNISADLPEQRISTLLEDLSSEDITQLVTSDPEWIYLFQHALTHEVAYESLPYARRQSLHQAMADWLVTRYADNLRPYYSILAYHYSQADNHELGLKYALAAGMEARDLFSNQEALEFFNQAELHLQAVGEEENWETAVSLYLARADILRWLGDLVQASLDAKKASQFALQYDLFEELAQAYNFLADITWRQSQFNEVSEWYDKVLDISDDISENTLARAYQINGLSATSLGEYDRALKDLEVAESLCRHVENRSQLALVLEAVAFVHYSRKNLELALSAMQQSVLLSRDASTPINLASSLNNISLVQFQLGQADFSLATLNEAIEVIGVDNINLFSQFIVNRAEISCYLGNFIQAKEDFEEAIRLFEMIDDQKGMLEIYLLMGYEYFVSLEDWDSARKVYDAANLILQQFPDRFFEAQARWFVADGQYQLLIDNLDASRDSLEKAISIIIEKEIVWWEPAAYYFLGNYFLRVDMLTEARTKYLQALNSIDNGGSPDYKPLLLLALSKIEPFDTQRIDLLEACLQSVEARSNYRIKKYCLREARGMLSNTENSDFQVMARGLLQKLEEMEK